jgi:regulator of CtrA degradation
MRSAALRRLACRPAGRREASLSELDFLMSEADPIHFGRTFVNSEAFKALFHEGMELVEDTAAYLDGAGREESRGLTRQGTLVYASESMRLTTRLMQIASWLLVQRAVAEGEITPAQAQAEKNRVRLNAQTPGSSIPDFEMLPQRLKDLIGLSARLHARILHLDQLISTPAPQPAAGPDNPVAVQQWLIERAFRDKP